MKVLITGIAGLLGSNLAHWLCSHQPNVEVIGVDDLSGGYQENIPAGVQFYKLNLLDFGGLSAIFDEHKPVLVFHFAAYAAEGLSPFIRGFNYQNNLVVTANVVTMCIKHSAKRLIFTSSMAVYGHGVPPFDEADRRSPIDPYGVAKAACEQDIEIAGEQHGLDWCIIRPHNFYGPRQNIWDSYRNVLGIWLNNRLTNKPITIFGDGKQVRAFSYIDDAMPCFWTAGTAGTCSKQIINLGGKYPYSVLQAASCLQEVTSGGDLVFLPARHEVKHAVSTWDKSERLLDFKHHTSLYDGLTEMWRWAQSQPRRPKHIWENYELDVGRYSFWDRDNLLN